MCGKTKAVIIFTLINLTIALIPSLSSAGELTETERDVRLAHAHELLGKHYRHSVVRTGEQVDQVNELIYQWTHDELPEVYKKDYQLVAQTIIDESLKHGFDPIFVMSVISNESSFRPTMVGGFGEIGLMQIKPATAKWIAKMADLPFAGKKSLRDPISNIKLGTAYLAYLREKFDSHARLYLAAYNMGQGNVNGALGRHVWPKDYAIRVMNHYISYYKQIQEQNDEKVDEAKRSIAEDASASHAITE